MIIMKVALSSTTQYRWIDHHSATHSVTHSLCSSVQHSIQNIGHVGGGGGRTSTRDVFMSSPSAGVFEASDGSDYDDDMTGGADVIDEKKLDLDDRLAYSNRWVQG